MLLSHCEQTDASAPAALSWTAHVGRKMRGTDAMSSAVPLTGTALVRAGAGEPARRADRVMS